MTCPTCGPTTVQQHPRHPEIARCANCCEWLGPYQPDLSPTTGVNR